MLGNIFVFVITFLCEVHPVDKCVLTVLHFKTIIANTNNVFFSNKKVALVG